MLYNPVHYERLRTVVESKYYTVDEIAELLHVSRVTVYSFINSGELRSIKFGKSRRVPESALSEFVTASEERAKHEPPGPVDEG
jgi:excisionase family DNA binding protein